MRPKGHAPRAAAARAHRGLLGTAIALVLAVAGAQDDPVGPAADPLVGVPACTVADRVLAGDPDADAATLLLDLEWRLPPGYAPSDLVDVAAAGFDPGPLVRAPVIEDLRALRTAAEAAGVRLAIQSAYRSEAYQAQVHEGWRAALGAARAAEVSARPGHSEHQLGTAVDLRSADGPPAWDLEDWAATPEGAWVAAHAERFGFVVAYPRGAQALACYDYEPWHLRWVGREVAAAFGAERAAWVAAGRVEAVPFRAWLHLRHPPTDRDAP